jgi:hypothetical protein
MPPGSPASFPGWNRRLEAAFHSPETTARFQATISRSKLPTCSFVALPCIRPTRSDSDFLTRPGSPRHAQDQYRNPVARLLPGIPSPSSGLHSPSGPFGPLKIKAFNPIPGRKVHLPSAPDCPSLPGIESILLVSIPDHRSRPAKRSVVCCSSDLLEPLSSCIFCHVTVKLKTDFGGVFLCLYFYLFHILSGKHGCTTCGKNVILGFCCWIPKASITIACRKHSSAVLGLLGRSQPWISGNAGTALGMRLATEGFGQPCYRGRLRATISNRGSSAELSCRDCRRYPAIHSRTPGPPRPSWPVLLLLLNAFVRR